MEQTTSVTRRRLIGGAAAAAAATAAVPALGPLAGTAGAQGRRNELLVPPQNIGIQLFTVRDLQAADVGALLTLLADIGYPEVELFTLAGQSAETWRALLAERQIRAIGAHVGIDRWRTELDTVLDEAELLGMHYVGVPGIFPAPPNTIEVYRALAREFNRYGEACAERGLRFYYHNHDWEFTVDRGQVLYDILLQDTDPDLVFFELDLYWTVTGGRDPLDYLGGNARAQSRFPLFHVKDRAMDGTFADLGEGTINFARIFSALRNKHYHHYIVERDTQVDPPRTARVGYEYLRSLRARRRGGGGGGT